jgi:hypothetical protein
MRARAKFQMQINVKCPRALCSIGHTGGRRGALSRGKSRPEDDALGLAEIDPD